MLYEVITLLFFCVIAIVSCEKAYLTPDLQDDLQVKSAQGESRLECEKDLGGGINELSYQHPGNPARAV